MENINRIMTERILELLKKKNKTIYEFEKEIGFSLNDVDINVQNLQLLANYFAMTTFHLLPSLVYPQPIYSQRKAGKKFIKKLGIDYYGDNEDDSVVLTSKKIDLCFSEHDYECLCVDLLDVLDEHAKKKLLEIIETKSQLESEEQ